MRLETSYFNKTILTKNITRFWPIWALYLLLWLFIMPLSLWGKLTSYDNIESVLSTHVIRQGFITGSVMAAAFGILAAMAVFSYLYAGRSAGMYHALPVRRENLFLTSYVSGLSFLAVPNIIVFLISVVVARACGCTDLSMLWSWLGIVSCMSLFFYSFGVFCAMFTGHILALPLFYIILNFVGVGIELFIKLVLSTFVFGMRYNREISLGFLSPLYQVNVVRPMVKGGFACWPIVIGYAVAGIILAGLALLIYRKRRIETAGDIIAVRPVKPVFKYGTAFCTALFVGYALKIIFVGGSNGTTAWKILAFMLPAGFIGYYAAEMLLKKSIHVIKSGLRGWLVFSGVLILLTASAEMDVFGYEGYVPDISEISEAYAGQNPIYENNGVVAADFTTDDEAMIRKMISLHESIVQNKAAIEGYHYAVTAANGIYSPVSTPVAISYVLKNGSTIQRMYSIPVSEALLSDDDSPASAFESLINAPGYILERNFPKELSVNDFKNGVIFAGHNAGMMNDRISEVQSFADVILNQEQSYRLYLAILKDIEAGTIGKTYLLYDDAYYNTVYACTIELRFNEAATNDSAVTFIDAAVFQVEARSGNTLSALKSLGLMDSIRLTTQGELRG